MADYHCTTNPIGRSAGRSSVAAAAYRAGSELVDQRTGLIHDYTRRAGVVSAEILMPDGGTADRSELWNAAESAENRKDSRTAREWIVALPHELDDESRKKLAHTFALELAARYGVAVDVAIHRPDKEGDQRNHHAHILTTTRQVSRGANGIELGAKTALEMGDKDRAKAGIEGRSAHDIVQFRERWADLANAELERAGRSERIDHRSLAAQGIDREATTHLGPVATDMERRGKASDRGDGNRQVASNNEQRRELSAQIIDLKIERERRAVVRQVETMPAADLVKAWDGRMGELKMGYRHRAQQLETKIQAQQWGISRKKQADEANHAKKRPVEPTGLLAAFKRSSYEKLMSEWRATAKRLKAWKVERQTDLQKRLERVRQYLSPTTPAHHLAEKKLQKERPEWAARLPQARAEVAREQDAQKQARQARQALQKGRPSLGKGHGL